MDLTTSVRPVPKAAAATCKQMRTRAMAPKAAGDFVPRLVDPANPSSLELQAIRATIEYHIKTLTRRRLNGDGADLDWFDDLYSLPLRRLDLGLRKRET